MSEITMLRQVRRRAVKLCTAADVPNQELIQGSGQPGYTGRRLWGSAGDSQSNTVARDPDSLPFFVS